MDRQYHHLLVTIIIIVIKYLYHRNDIAPCYTQNDILFKNRISGEQRQLPLLHTENQENMRKQNTRQFCYILAIVIRNNHTLRISTVNNNNISEINNYKSLLYLKCKLMFSNLGNEIMKWIIIIYNFIYLVKFLGVRK